MSVISKISEVSKTIKNPQFVIRLWRIGLLLFWGFFGIYWAWGIVKAMILKGISLTRVVKIVDIIGEAMPSMFDTTQDLAFLVVAVGFTVWYRKEVDDMFLADKVNEKSEARIAAAREEMKKEMAFERAEMEKRMDEKMEKRILAEREVIVREVGDLLKVEVEGLVTRMNEIFQANGKSTSE